MADVEKPLKFYEKINQKLAAAVKQLVAEHPEFEGAAIALTYDAALGDIANSCLVICDQKDPELYCRMGVQTAKLQTAVSQGIAMHCRQASIGLETIKREVDAQRSGQDAESSGQKTP